MLAPMAEYGTKAEPKATSEADLLKRVIDDYDEHKSYIRPYHKTWENHWKLWDNKRVKRQYFGVNDSFEPMTHQMVESTVDNVYGSAPGMRFVPTMPEQEKDTKVLNGHWDYCWDKNDMDLELDPIGRENEITGNSVIFCGWDPDGAYMTMEHFPIRDVIFIVTARKPTQMTGIGYERLAMVDDLRKEKRFDPEANDGKGEWVKKYNIPDDITSWTSAGDDMTDKELKDMYKGSTLSKEGQKKQLHIICMRYLDKFIEVANKKHVISVIDNPFHKDAHKVKAQLHEDGEPMYDEEKVPDFIRMMTPEEKLANKDVIAKELQDKAQEITEIDVPEIAPFLGVAFHRGGYVDPSQLLAKSNVEPFAGSQEDLNDMLNEKKDNLAERVQNKYLFDKDQPELRDELANSKPGSLIPADGIADGKEPVRALEKPEASGDADIEMTRLKQSIRDTARVDQTTQGLGSENDRTATEVRAQVAGASSGFASRRRRLRAGLYKQLGGIYIKMLQIFLTEKQLIRILGDEGVEFKLFDPSKWFGPYDVKVELEDDAMAQAESEKKEAVAFYGAFRGDPDFNQIELKKRTARKLGISEDEIETLMNPDPNNGAMMGGVPVGDGTDGSPVMDQPLPAPQPLQPGPLNG